MAIDMEHATDDLIDRIRAHTNIADDDAVGLLREAMSEMERLNLSVRMLAYELGKVTRAALYPMKD